ncbi:hypothetical protein PAXINDRAFT_176232 [Paxillus involutus ATCC 200175]|nr:hypothetical protein PAXINDRAFT_176232 [Paxillus involutus ATCC 200175]
MDSRRAETLEALSAYLQNQRSFLARTQADIERLKQLKSEALASPQQFVSSNSERNGVPISQLLSTGEKISELQDYHPALSFPDKIDWDVFSSSDATPLRTLAIRTRIDHTQRSVPPTTQRSPLSVLQKFVKDARKIILDPVLESLSGSADTIALPNLTNHSNPINTSSSSTDPNNFLTLAFPTSLSEDENEEEQRTPVVQESMTATRKRERARAKIRELKRRKIRSDLVVGCKLGEEGSSAVFVRHDIEDESAEVDVSMETARYSMSAPLEGPSDQVSDAMDVDGSIAETLVEAPQSTKLRIPATTRLLNTRQRALPQVDSFSRSCRSRKPSLKLQTRSHDMKGGTHNEPSSIPLTPAPSQTLGKRSRDTPEIKNTGRQTKTEPLSTPADADAETDKSRSDTYKQAWSISEQHLLERLLEEIPDGERNRWAKISQAMGGRRTPRQVASRVQKYFEKLKRFGVGVDKKGKAKL